MMSGLARPANRETALNLAREGKRLVDICKIMDISQSTCFRWLKSAGFIKNQKEKALVVKLRAENMMIKDISKVVGVNFYTVSYWLKKAREAKPENPAVFIDRKPKFQIVEINSLKIKLVNGKPWKWSGEWINTTITAAVVRAQMEEDRLNGEMKFWYEKRDL